MILHGLFYSICGIQLFTIHKLSVFVFFLFIIMHSNTGSKKNKNILINQYLLS